MAYVFNPFTGTLDIVSGIGTSVIGGTAGSVLFVGTGPVLAENNGNFFWDDANKELRLGGVGLKNGKFILRTEATDDYGIYLDARTTGSTSVLNAFNGLYFDIKLAGASQPLPSLYGIKLDQDTSRAISDASITSSWSHSGLYLNMTVGGAFTDASSFASDVATGLNFNLTNASGTVTGPNYVATRQAILAQITTTRTYNNAGGSWIEINYGNRVSISGNTTVTAGSLTKVSYGNHITIAGTAPSGSTHYGCYLSGISGATSNWGFYDNAGANNYFKGNVAISPSLLTPTSRLHIVETDNTKLQAVSFQGYSDGGSATQGVLEIKNEIGQRVCLLAGSNLSGTADYGEMMFYGYATAATDLYSFGDFNWINNSGEATGDLRMGTMRVYRDGGAYNGTWSVVLRNGVGGFISAQTQKYTGQMGLKNVTSPTAWLHLPAGTSSASQAPLKFTSGTLQTTAEAGAMEFLTDKYYGTITTGAARKEFVLANIALTSGRVPFNTTNGRLTDSSNFTYTSGTGMSITEPSPLLLTQTDPGGGTPTILKVVGGTITNTSTLQEVTDVYFNLARAITHSAGNITNQRSVIIDAPTHVFGGASVVTNAVTFAIVGPPVAHPSATFTNTWSMWIQSGISRFDGSLSLNDASDVVLGTTTGTKFGTATTQKLAFYNSTPIVQPNATTDLGTVLSNLGLRAAGTAYPITTSGTLTLTGTVNITDVNIVLGTTTGTKIGTATTQKLGFFNKTPITQPSSTGETAGISFGPGTNVTDFTSFTGNVGTTAYYIDDIVKHLKNLGLIAA